MRLGQKHVWFLAFTAVFAVLAGFVFWGTWSPNVAFVAPDDGIFFSSSYGDTLLNWRNMFVTTGKAHPLDALWSGLVVSPLFCSQLKYVVPTFLSAVALSWFLKGRGLSNIASYGAGLFLGFSGYWLTLFSAGHGNWFVWMSYGVFAFGLVDRAMHGNRMRHWLLLGLVVAWASFYMPDIWLLFTTFTTAYLIFCMVRYRCLPIVGPLAAVLVFALVAAPSIYSAFVNDLAGRDKQVEESKGTALGGSDSRDEAETRWVFATNWSMPVADTLEFMIPRIHGDTSCPLTLSINQSKGIQPYSGALGRPIDADSGNYRQHSLYIGFVTCLFALIGCGRGFMWIWTRKRSPHPSKSFDAPVVLFFMASAAVFYLFSLGRNCEPVYRIVYALPFGDYLRAPVKWHHLTEFCVVVLSGYGIQSALEWTEKWHFSRWIILLVVLSGACNLAYEAHVFCAPVDYSRAARTNCSSHLTVLSRQHFANRQVREMLRVGRILPVAKWLGGNDAQLVQILEPIQPVESAKANTVPFCLGIVSVLAAISVVVVSSTMKARFPR